MARGPDRKGSRQLAGAPDSKDMFRIVEEMLRKTKCLCSLMDNNVVEETLAFLEDNRVTVKPEKDEFAESVAEFMQRNRMRINLPQISMASAHGKPSMQTPVTEFISKELRTPDNFVVDLNLGNLHNKESLGGATNYFTSAYTS